MADRRGLAGAGVYAVNEAGHARITPFPDVVSDDGFVHRTFAPGERVVTTGASSVVRPAATFGAVLRRRVRVRQGNEQLDTLGLPRAEGRLQLGALTDLARRRAVSPVDAAWYLALLAVDRSWARWLTARGGQLAWGTDESSRRSTTTAVGWH
jgi:hypothetical protein